MYQTKVPNHYLNQFSLIVNNILKNKLRWKLNWNDFHSIKQVWKSLQNGGHFVQASWYQCVDSFHLFLLSGSSPESAKEALLQVLTLSGTPLDFDDVSPPPQARPIDPLMQLEVYPTNCALLHRSSLTNIHTLGRTSSAKSRYYKSNMRRSVSAQLNSNSNNLDSDDKDKENLRSRASSKSSDLLDRILNEDDWIKEEEEEGRGNRGKGKKAICDKTLKKQSESCQDLCSSITDRSVSKDSGISSIPASESFSNSPQSQRKDVEPSASTPRKRYTHHRSASDFALPGRPPQEHEPPRRMSCNSPSEALSSSLPDRESKSKYSV